MISEGAKHVEINTGIWTAFRMYDEIIPGIVTSNVVCTCRIVAAILCTSFSFLMQKP